MKLTKLLFVVACLLGLVAGGFAQNAETKETRGTFGYLDSKTGVFHRLTRTPLPAEAPAITPTTGKFVFNVTITVSSALPTTAAIGCSVFGGVDDLTSGAFSNSVSVTATRSGNTATCTLNIPYSWDLANASKDTVNLDLTVNASASTTGSGFYEEEFSAPVLTIKVPANGTTTTENITTTI